MNNRHNKVSTLLKVPFSLFHLRQKFIEERQTSFSKMIRNLGTYYSNNNNKSLAFYLTFKRFINENSMLYESGVIFFCSTFVGSNEIFYASSYSIEFSFMNLLKVK